MAGARDANALAWFIKYGGLVALRLRLLISAFRFNAVCRLQLRCAVGERALQLQVELRTGRE